MIAYQGNAIDFILKREIFCRTVALHDKVLLAGPTLLFFDNCCRK